MQYNIKRSTTERLKNETPVFSSLSVVGVAKSCGKPLILFYRIGTVPYGTVPYGTVHNLIFL